MKMNGFFLFFALSLNLSNAISQTKQELKKEKQNLLDTLQRKISGVKFADFGLSEAQQNYVINNPSSIDAIILSSIVNYLKREYKLISIITNDQKIESYKLAKSQCDFVKIEYELGTFNSKFIAIGNFEFSFSFLFCDNFKYSFNTKLKVNGLTNYNELIKNTFNYNLPIKVKYNERNKLILPKMPIIISLNEFKNYLDTSKMKNQYEGIYQVFISNISTSKYTLGIYSQNDSLKLVYFNGADFSEDWSEGELKGYLEKTKSESDFILKLYTLNKILIDGSISFNSTNSFEMKSTTIGLTDNYVKYIRIK